MEMQMMANFFLEESLGSRSKLTSVGQPERDSTMEKDALDLSTVN